MKRLLSLGAGVQSSVVLMLSEAGKLPRLDGAIFADTKWEPDEVYEHLEWLKSRTTIPIHTVSVGDLRADFLHYQKTHSRSPNGLYAAIPLYLLNPDGTHGMVRRQCTERYKIRPISKKVRELVGLGRGCRSKELLCEQWLGISWDEVDRIKPPLFPWIQNRYPLIDMKWTRQKCLDWWNSRFDRALPRSACLGCPFHSDAEWQRLKSIDPAGFQNAVQFEREAQRANAAVGSSGCLRGTPFLHALRKPLDKIDFERKAKGAKSLWSNECTGVCGV